jgi:hypothetical protein
MRVTSRFTLFVAAAVVVVFVGLAVWANARSRRQLEALDEGSDDMQRAGDTGQPPSSSGYLGPLD